MSLGAVLRGSAVASGGKQFLPNMQVLRFIASTMVLISHLDREARATGVAGSLARFMDFITVPWSCGVDIFFCISGFLMMFLSFENFQRPNYPAEFIKRRAIRVLPLYWLFTAVFIVVTLADSRLVTHSDITPTRVFTSLFFIPYLRATGDVYPVLALGWTINYEILFYVLFACALSFNRRIAIPGLIGLFLLASIANHWVPSDWIALKFWTNPIILEFLMGIGLSLLYIRGVRLPLAARVALVVGGFALLIAMLRFGLADTETWVSPIPRAFWAGIPSALIVGGFMLGSQIRATSVWEQLLILGGGASYSLYLTHMFATRSVTVLWRVLKLHNGWAFFGVGFVAAMTLSVVVFLLIETPLLNYLRRRFEPSRRVLAA